MLMVFIVICLQTASKIISTNRSTLNSLERNMDTELDFVSRSPAKNLIDPNGFDVSMTAVLIGLGAEKYINIFKEHNIGQCTLIELTDEDLIKLGVDDPQIRIKLIEEVKNLPIYEETDHTAISANLDIMDIIQVMEESTQHMYRIYISMMSNTLVLKKKNVPDCLVYKDKYASHIAITTLSQMTNVLNSMEIALHNQIKILSKDSRNRRTKKLIVGTLGSAAVAVLAIYFVRSLKQFH